MELAAVDADEDATKDSDFFPEDILPSFEIVDKRTIEVPKVGGQKKQKSK